MNTTKPEVSAVDVELPKPDGYWFETFAGWSFCNTKYGKPTGKRPVINMYTEATLLKAIAADRAKQAQTLNDLQGVDSRNLELMAEIQELQERLAKQAGQSEAVYAFRRKGLNDFCTCSEERYLELSAKPNLFEVTTFYTTPQPSPVAQPVQVNAELVAVLKEAAAFIHAVNTGTEPVTRYPLADELEGFAAMLSQSAQLSQPQGELAEKLKEYALQFAPDYPGVGTLSPWEHLYALTSCLEGTLAANADLHALLEAKPVPLVPLTAEKVFASTAIMAANARIGIDMPSIMAIVAAVEEEHDITAQGEQQEKKGNV